MAFRGLADGGNVPGLICRKRKMKSSLITFVLQDIFRKPVVVLRELVYGNNAIGMLIIPAYFWAYARVLKVH